MVPLLWKSQQGKRWEIYTTNKGKGTPKQPSFIIKYLVYEFINDIPEPLVGQLQRSWAISICRRLDDRINTFSKNIVRTGGIDKLKNTRTSLKWEMEQQMNEAASMAEICSFDYFNCLHFQRLSKCTGLISRVWLLSINSQKLHADCRGLS